MEKILIGFATTFFLSIACFVTASLLAVLTCAGFCSKNKILRTVAKVYNGVVIKIPPLVMLMLFALLLTGNRTNGSVLIAYIGLSLFVASNLTGVFFGGVCSVAPGEIEAARTLGFDKRQAFFHIMLPQILSNITPVYMSMFVMCVQITSVSSVIGVTELLGVTDGIGNAWAGIAVSVVSYFLIGTLGDLVIARMGKRKQIKARDSLGSAEAGSDESC